MELFVNRVSATLAAGMDASQTSMPLTAGHGARFGTIGAGDKVRIAMLDASLNVSEIVYATARTTDTLTVVRGQDGTVGTTHLISDRIEARIGKSTMDSLTQKAKAGTDAIAETHAATNKATPVDADELPLADSASTFALNRITWVNLKASIKAWLVAQVNSYTAAQAGVPVALTSTTNSIAINLALANNFTHLTTENTTLAAPTNPVAGQSGVIVITQGATAQTLAYNAFWKFKSGTIPNLTATAGAVDLLAYYVESNLRATCSLLGDSK